MNFFGTVCENVYASVTSPKVVANIGYIRSKSSFSQIIQPLNLPLIAFKSSSTNPETKRTSSNDFWTELELVSAWPSNPTKINQFDLQWDWTETKFIELLQVHFSKLKHVNELVLKTATCYSSDQYWELNIHDYYQQ